MGGVSFHYYPKGEFVEERTTYEYLGNIYYGKRTKKYYYDDSGTLYEITEEEKPKRPKTRWDHIEI